MVKKVFALALGLVLTMGAMAQWEQPFNPTVPQSDIQFWTGSGSNRAVIAITWADDEQNVGIAWGVQWNGNDVLLRDLMDTIAAYDSRMTITWNSSHTFINNLAYADDVYDLIGEIDPDNGYAWFMYGWKGDDETVKSSGGIMADVIADGDFIDWNLMDMETFETLLADTMLMASDPNAPVEPQPEEATIAASEVTYWVGQGSNQVVLAVNWADTALAWGYRFSTDSVSVQQVMDAIMAADHRFSYTMDGYYLGDINFVLGGTDTFGITPGNYFESKRNGISDAGMSQNLGNGDFEKWADPAAGVVVDSVDYGEYGIFYIYVYPMTIYPVSDPAGIASVENLSVSVFPNPAAAMVNVTFDALEQTAEAALYDMSGRAVYRRSLAAGSTGVQVPVNQLGEGVYLLRVAGAAAKVVVSR